MDIENMTEQQALDVFYAMRMRFGWQGSIYSRQDVADIWETFYADDVTVGDDFVARITDEQWQAVLATSEWRGVSGYMDSEGAQAVRDAVDSARRLVSSRKCEQ